MDKTCFECKNNCRKETTEEEKQIQLKTIGRCYYFHCTCGLTGNNIAKGDVGCQYYSQDEDILSLRNAMLKLNHRELETKNLNDDLESD